MIGKILALVVVLVAFILGVILGVTSYSYASEKVDWLLSQNKDDNFIKDMIGKNDVNEIGEDNLGNLTIYFRENVTELNAQSLVISKNLAIKQSYFSEGNKTLFILVPESEKGNWTETFNNEGIVLEVM